MNHSLKILLVDDDEVDRTTVRRVLNRMHRGVVVEEAIDISSGLEALRDSHYDCAIVDYRLPDGTGASFVKEVAGRDEMAVPIVVLTGRGDRKVDLEVMEAGASDYLEKDALQPDLLDRAIRYAIQNNRLVKKLKEANEKLKEADRAKSEFLSTASHELRTPLTIIREFVALVHDGLAGEINQEQSDCLSSALNNCDRLGIIINDLLDLQRIESGRIRFTRRKTEIADLLHRCYQDFIPRCSVRKQQLHMNVPEKLPSVLCDHEMITQVLVNFLGNAVKFTQDGGRVTLKARVRNKKVFIEVEDNGPGIKFEEQERIFEKFTQVDRKHGPGIKGTGLGLAISKKIVELHEGRIEVNSSPGIGTKFSFFLPLYQKNSELRAFLKDHAGYYPMEVGMEWYLVLLKSDGGEEGEGMDLLRKVEVVVNHSLCRQNDKTLLLEEEVLVILIQSNTEGKSVFLSRIAEVLEQEFDTGFDFFYAMVALKKESFKSIRLSNYEERFEKLRAGNPEAVKT